VEEKNTSFLPTSSALPPPPRELLLFLFAPVSMNNATGREAQQSRLPPVHHTQHHCCRDRVTDRRMNARERGDREEKYMKAMAAQGRKANSTPDRRGSDIAGREVEYGAAAAPIEPFQRRPAWHARLHLFFHDIAPQMF